MGGGQPTKQTHRVHTRLVLPHSCPPSSLHHCGPWPSCPPLSCPSHHPGPPLLHWVWLSLASICDPPHKHSLAQVTLSGGSEYNTAWEVVGGCTLELTLAQFWTSAGASQLETVRSGRAAKRGRGRRRRGRPGFGVCNDNKCSVRAQLCRRVCGAGGGAMTMCVKGLPCSVRLRANRRTHTRAAHPPMSQKIHAYYSLTHQHTNLTQKHVLAPRACTVLRAISRCDRLMSGFNTGLIPLRSVGTPPGK